MSAELEAPPPHAVPWRVRDREDDQKQATVSAQLWTEAKELGAAALGVPIERVVAERQESAHG
jgi:hypothetical protein